MLLSQNQALALLSKYKIEYPTTVIINSNETFTNSTLCFPVVLKVDSPEVIHKSDLGLVFTGLKNESEVNEKIKTAREILTKNGIKDYRFIVQETVKGIELVMGMKQDASFGPVILFGLGGIFVEVVKDTSLRIAPLKKSDCVEMLEEIKGKKLLEGYRGLPPANKNELVNLLMNLSNLAMHEPSIRETDFNPVIVNDNKALVVDARFIC